MIFHKMKKNNCKNQFNVTRCFNNFDIRKIIELVMLFIKCELFLYSNIYPKPKIFFLNMVV